MGGMIELIMLIQKTGNLQKLGGRKENVEMLDHFNDMDKRQEVLREAQTGLWVIELGEGKPPRMYADSVMLELLGFDNTPTPEECYNTWYERIEDAYYPIVQSGVEKIISDTRAEVQYSWNHPHWGKIYVRCGGVRDNNYKNGVCLRGYHQNITDTVMLKQEYDSVIQTLNQSYCGIFLCNLEDGSYKVIRIQDKFKGLLSPESDYCEILRRYAKQGTDGEYRQQILELAEPGALKDRINRGEYPIERLYRNRNGRWRRIRIQPSGQYTESHPWVIVAFDEQDYEVEKRADQAGAQAAVSQIYKLVVNVDADGGMYNCIYASDEFKDLHAHGSYEEFCGYMMVRMPLEDRRKFNSIFDKDKDACLNGRNLDGMIRMWETEGVLHYYDYSTVRIFKEMGERMLFTLRNIDDKQKERKLERVLSNLCQCYYSIYLFDLDHDEEEPIWQEDVIAASRDFIKGKLSDYYEKFIRLYVYQEDREKMRRAGSVEFLRQTLTEEQPVFDIDFRRIYGDHLEWVRSRFSIAEIEDGRVSKVIFANMNINEQKLEELEEEKKNRAALMDAFEKAKSANEAKSQFLAQMSHDIRTPMNAIVGMSAIASAHLDEKERVRDCLEKINVSSSHLLSLINEILDMSKIEKGRLELAEEPFCLRALINDINSIVRAEVIGKKLTIRFNMDDVIHEAVIGDENRIRQVLLNLISNSIKYTPEGGQIRVAVKEVFVRSEEQRCFVFTVEDNGIGMSEEFQKFIFAPFSREEEVKEKHIQGTGLGMSIAHGIVSAMKGDIQVESEKGRGSRFTVTLYLGIRTSGSDCGLRQDPEQEENGGFGEPAAGTSPGWHILLAEDNELNMEIAQTLLQESGLTVDCTVNGREAAERFLSSAPGTYDAILMDLQMPVMDGYTSAREIRGSAHPQAADIPIIALTANAFAEDIARAMTSGMNDHVAKPVDFGKLLAILKKNIGD